MVKRAATSVLTSLAWGAAALVYATHLYLYHRLQEQPASFVRELGEAGVHFGVWAALTPVVLWLARRYELLDRRWARRLPIHVGAALLVALVQLALHSVLDQVLLHQLPLALSSLEKRLRLFFVRTYYANVVVYFALVLGASALALLAQRRSRQAELERHLTQAQLDALRQQLQPHFLFNALHAVSALIPDDPQAALRMVARLSDLLRLVLEQRTSHEVRFDHELEMARCYLRIEEVRFADRLQVEVHVEPALGAALVPALLLQPLLENAVRHGIARKPGPGRIEVRAERASTDRSRLRLTVRDDGEGLSLGEAAFGIGLANVRERLERLYGAEQSLELRDAAGGGAEVRVELPLRLAAGGTP